MQNIINFDVRSDYTCSCVANIFNGAETINLFFEADEYIAPQLEVTTTTLKTTTTTVYDLEVINGFAVFNLDHTTFISCQIKYIDGTKSGTTFYFLKSGTTYSTNTTMKVVKSADDRFDIDFIVKYQSNSFSDDFEIDENGELSIKSPIEINVTKQDDEIINVRIVYKKPTETEPGDEKSYNCTYNADGNLTRFGDLPIVWNGG